ncbi:TonB-dependent receptor [Hymenobacter latericus]|uniref:TonB-dependent receptor n=1 Tax=Hymenobacter sp. YIM 151858-1 TaxID=2987688 RepID=UPI0022275137|nr:TonB-dependent receptor [Hymenobacter sp. YIM 151858-1]UYZ58529.1 TonB-dependent receptor [Hymenobacter sp. YIM 151858-1]
MKYCYPLILSGLLLTQAAPSALAQADNPAGNKGPAAQPPRTAPTDNTLQAIGGVIRTDEGMPLPGATVFVKGTFIGTSTDQFGKFRLEAPFGEQPVVLVVSYVGYQTQELELRVPDNQLSVGLSASPQQLNETVVSASRVEEQIMRAPVTVEKITGRQIERISTPEVLAGLGQFKGVDVNSASMLFTSISTRGFNTAKSERVIQLYDYADSQLPSLNLSPGNLVGIPEVDMESIEIVHGPASALYGANAFNGVVLFNSKDPFVYEGLTMRLRGGERNFLDGQLRYARRITEKLAFKVSGSYLTANDWIARNYEASATSDNPEGSALGYDAVNRYGDLSYTFTPQQQLPGGTSPELYGRRLYAPGYTEQELIADDNKTRSYRVEGTLAYLLRDDLKLTLSARRAAGTATYQNLSRFRIKDLGINQYRMELKSSKGFLRAYSTQDFSGDSYELNLLGSFLTVAPAQEGASFSYADQYISTYNAVYKQARSANRTVDQALAMAQAAAAGTMLKSTDPRFATLRQQLIGNDDPVKRGAKMNLDSYLHDVSGQRQFKLAEATQLTVGAAYRAYRLGSGGRIFGDTPGNRVRNHEYGAYAQVTQTLLDDHLKLAAAARIDEFKNFKAAVSPRASAVYSFGAEKQHSLRSSFGSAFRSPAQLEQFTQVDIIGRVYQGNIGNGYQGYSLVNSQGQAFGTAPLSTFELTVKPLGLERVNTLEVGYKGVILPKLYADVNFYSSRYNDFIGATYFIGNTDGTRPTPQQLQTAQRTDFGPGQPTRFLFVYNNNEQEVRTRGGAVGLTYYALRALHLSANYSLNVLDRDNLPQGFVTFFNTPKHKYNVGAEGQVGQHLHYNVNYRWVQSHLQEMPFATGTISDYSTLDASAGYTLPKLGTTLQLGASNLLNNDNVQVYGGPGIGRLAYLGLLIELK